MESLQKTLERVTAENKRAEKLRRYIVVEAVYQVSFVALFCIFSYSLFSVLSWGGGFSLFWHMPHLWPNPIGLHGQHVYYIKACNCNGFCDLNWIKSSALLFLLIFSHVSIYLFIICNNRLWPIVPSLYIFFVNGKNVSAFHWYKWNSGRGRCTKFCSYGVLLSIFLKPEDHKISLFVSSWFVPKLSERVLVLQVIGWFYFLNLNSCANN